MTKHRALEDTLNRAQHYGAMAVDALALFPASPMKAALGQVVAFCLARSHECRRRLISPSFSSQP